MSSDNPQTTESLVQFGWFRSHSGLQLPWKLDADALSSDSLNGITQIIRWKFAFGAVIGVPRGGLRLARMLEQYREDGYPTLIVDDVLTTGKSIQEWRDPVPGPAIGVVIFARGPCPNWVWPIFNVNEWTQSRATGLG